MPQTMDPRPLNRAWWKRPLGSEAWGAIPPEGCLQIPRRVCEVAALPRGVQVEFSESGAILGVAVRASSENLPTLLQILLSLQELRWLSLQLPNLTDADMIRLPPCPTLTTLNLATTQIGDPTAAWLRSSCAALTHLDLGHTLISDRGMKCLARLPALQELVVDGTAITCSSLEAWRGAGRLRHLSAVGTAIPPAALQKLQTTLPNAATFRWSC
jgi:Leucine Rich repeat